MRNVHRHEDITVYVNPAMLRHMADDMEKQMKDLQIGGTVWSEHFRGEGLTVKLMADQDWFHRRDEGIPDWDHMPPGPEVLKRFDVIGNEAREFPDTYSGAAWRAAYRIWKATEEHGADILDVGGYDSVPHVDVKGLGLSGFQYGWAVNAMRGMLGKPAGPNPAVVTVGGPQEPMPAEGPAEGDMRGAMGS